MKKIAFIVLVVAILLIGGYGVYKAGVLPGTGKKLSLADAKTRVETYITSAGLQGITVKEVQNNSAWVYTVIWEANEQKGVSYMTKDGKQFFESALDLNAKPNTTAAVVTPNEKSDKPIVELFVMSHCPYGTQIEKGLLPVLDTLGSKIDFSLKFVDYAMHGELELREELIQYCVQKNYPEKLPQYLLCYLEAGTTCANETDQNALLTCYQNQSKTCITSLSINLAEVETCVNETDSTYKVMEKFADKSTWLNGYYPTFDIYKTDNEKYNVKGSPTLVVNGNVLDGVARDPAALLFAICGGFTTTPDECNVELSSATPAPGFGLGTVAGSATDASCN